MRISKFTFIHNVLSSLKTNSEGYSGRKISAAVCVAAAIYIAIYKLPELDRINSIYAFLVFSLLCLGLVTIPQLIEIINSKKSENENLPK